MGCQRLLDAMRLSTRAFHPFPCKEVTSTSHNGLSSRCAMPCLLHCLRLAFFFVQTTRFTSYASSECNTASSDTSWYRQFLLTLHSACACSSQGAEVFSEFKTSRRTFEAQLSWFS